MEKNSIQQLLEDTKLVNQMTMNDLYGPAEERANAVRCGAAAAKAKVEIMRQTAVINLTKAKNYYDQVFGELSDLEGNEANQITQMEDAINTLVEARETLLKINSFVENLNS